MKYCFNCGRPLIDEFDECTCMNVKMTDDMIKNIQNNSYDLYDKERLDDLIKSKIIESEKELADTISVLNDLESSLKKLGSVKKTITKINRLYEDEGNLKKVDVGLLSSDTVWKTKERYYEILDEIKETINNLEQ